MKPLAIRHPHGLLSIVFCLSLCPTPFVAAQALQLPMEARPWQLKRDSPVVIEIPNPIALKSIRLYAQWLQLSEEQRIYAESIFAHEYLPAIQHIDTEHADRIRPMAQQFADPRIGDKPGFGTFFTNWRHEEEFICKAVEIADHKLLDAIEAVLADEQMALMPRVRWHRDRSAQVSRLDFARARIDLSQIINELDLPPNVINGIHGLLIKYEQAVTPALVDADRIKRESRGRIEAIVYRLRFDDDGQHRAPTDHKENPQLAELGDRLASIESRVADAQLDVASVNDQFFAQIREALPSSHAHEFTHRYKCMAFPRVYPDHCDPETVVQDILARPQLDDDRTELIRLHWTEYRQRYERICRQMESASAEWQKQRLRNKSSSGWQEHNAKIAEWYNARLALSHQHMELIRTLLPDAHRHVLEPLIDQWVAAAKQRSELQLRRLNMNRSD